MNTSVLNNHPKNQDDMHRINEMRMTISEIKIKYNTKNNK